MAAFPSLTDFKILLKEDIAFKDHLNIFLQLPIFAKRLHYSTITKQFNICPYPVSNFQDIDHHNVWRWVYTHRLPLFWRSEFYFSYRLCYEFVNNQNPFLDNAQQPFSTIPCTAKELQKFILYLRCSPGEAYCLLWLDLEKLRLTDTAQKQRQLISRIKQLYLLSGAPFQLELPMRKEVLVASCEALTLKDEIATLLSSQSRVLEVLKHYWYEQYLTQITKRSTEDDSDSSDEEEIDDHYPHLVVDRGNEGADITVPHEQLKKRLLNKQPIHISNNRRRDYYLAAKNRDDQAKPMLSSSTQMLFPLSVVTSTSNKHIESSWLRKRLIPFMQASIRCSFAAGNPILEYFKETYEFEADESVKAQNFLLFWQSIELLLTRDEMKRWYNGIRQLNSDLTCPYLNLFSGHPLATDLETLLELYIDDNSEFYVELPIEIQRQLHILLPKGLGHSLLLETQDYACKVLQPYWEKYVISDNDSFQAECVIQRDLSHLSDSIQKEQSILFHESQSSERVLLLTFDPSDDHVVRKMWRSVEYSEVIENPGLLHLPSRLAMHLYTQPIAIGTSTRPDNLLSSLPEDTSRVSTPGDIGPISYRGIQLVPMITTISTTSQRTINKLTRTTVFSSQPATIGDALKKKPPIPKSFSTMMKSSEHLESFYQFLSTFGNGADMSIVFWLAIEDMKDSIGDEKSCVTKIRRIMRRFFKEGIDITLHCRDTTLLEVASLQNPTPFQLMDAQESIVKSLESRWYSDYLKFLSGKYGQEKETKNNDEETKLEEKKPFVREHSRGFWDMFTRNVTSFRRGLMDPPTLTLFKKYLANEVLNGDVSGKKKLIGSKVINVTKLLNDLSFWAEVERFKDMADVVNAAKNSGNYTPEDEIMIHKKAHAIVNCYIDSSVPPKVQINVAPEIVSSILNNLSKGHIVRGMFHEAALNIFCILILYWKKFCVWRRAPTSHSSSTSLHSHGSSGHWSTTLQVESCDSHMMLDGCILSFSLKTGLRLIRPSSREKPVSHHDHESSASFNHRFTPSFMFESNHTIMLSTHLSKISTTVQ